MTFPTADGWLLDTNVISAWRRLDRAPPAFIRWTARAERQTCFLSAVTIAELVSGIERAPQPAQRTELTRWLEQDVRPRFEARILGVDEAVLMSWQRLRWVSRQLGSPVADPDALIASTAIVHRLVLVTRNLKHFTNVGVLLLDPWASA